MEHLKCRAKRIDNEEWVDGYYANCRYKDKPETGHFIIKHLGEYHEIFTGTVSRYTGLKDSKGNKIYEGDIIKEYTTEDEYLLAEVIYTKGCFMGKEPGHDPVYPIYDFWGGEVIGNVYENPELLGGKYVQKL